MKVAVIGGGFAGLAAAIALQERRHEVVLLERRGVLGGRASSSRDAVSGEDVDNGTHLMVGAYRSTLDLVSRAGASALLLEQDRLRLEWADEKGVTALDCPRLVAPPPGPRATSSPALTGHTGCRARRRPARRLPHHRDASGA